MPNAAWAPHVGLLFFAAGAALEGSSTTRTGSGSSASLTVSADLSGDTVSHTSASGSLSIQAALSGGSITHTASAGALDSQSALAGSSVTRTGADGSLTTQAALAGDSVTHTAAPAANFSATGPLLPGPLPHLSLLGGLGSSSAAVLVGGSVTHTATPGAALTTESPLSGASITRTASEAALTVLSPGELSPGPLPHLSLLGGMGVATSVQPPMPLPHLALLGGASSSQVLLEGYATTRTGGAPAAELSIGYAMLSGLSVTRTGTPAAELTTPTTPIRPMPLPHLALLGGASSPSKPSSNKLLTGAYIDPSWLKFRQLALTDDSVALSGSSVTRTSAYGVMANAVGPAGIASSAFVGSMTLARISLQGVTGAGGIVSGEGFGAPSFGTGSVIAAVNVGGIATAQALGTPQVTRLRLDTVAPAGIVSEAALGAPQVLPDQYTFSYPVNLSLSADRYSAYRIHRWAIAAQPILLGHTEIDDTLSGTSSTQGRKIAGAADTVVVNADYFGTQLVLNFVTQDFTGSFTAGLTVDADYAGVMEVQAFSNADYSGEFEALGAIGQEWGGAFDVQALVSADYSGAFLGDGVNSLIDADYAGAFDVLAGVDADYAGAFEVFESISADYMGGFDAFGGVDADYSGGFEVLVLVSRDWRSRFLGGPMGGGVVMVPPAFDHFLVPPPFSNVMTALDD